MSPAMLLKAWAVLTLLATLLPQVSPAAVDEGEVPGSVMKQSTNACEAAGGTCTKDSQCNNRAPQLECSEDAPYCCLSSSNSSSTGDEGGDGQHYQRDAGAEGDADHKQARRRDNDARRANNCVPNTKCADAGGVCTQRRQCTTRVLINKCGKNTKCECCLLARTVTKAPSPAVIIASDEQQQLVNLSAIVLDLLSLQNTITNALTAIIRFILSIVAPDVDFSGRRTSISKDVDNLHATAAKLVKTVMSRNTLNIKTVIIELESQRISLMKHDPRGITRADVDSLSRTSKLLVSVMRVLPDMYDAALTKAVSIKMQQG
ncbi:uncharacterized protein LOC126997754 [Eriocheir sinensis]|uniref:uncharacterized protein LOC126997754 n=1 Tax=Eriocheir sinensis TaxID=95602 RepID=UPI0021CA2CB6|nr:uncharacterized protein LOC126997754 [Eriocheir sinensis]